MGSVLISTSSFGKFDKAPIERLVKTNYKPTDALSTSSIMSD